MEDIDPEETRSLLWMVAEGSQVAECELTFSTERSIYGVREVVDLIPGGRTVPVTEENKVQYVNAYSKWAMTTSIAD